jgi:hypothetical protein
VYCMFRMVDQPVKNRKIFPASPDEFNTVVWNVCFGLFGRTARHSCSSYKNNALDVKPESDIVVGIIIFFPDEQ